MAEPALIVPDTNFLISARLFRGSKPDLCLRKAQRSATLLASEETLAELSDVLMRSKFDRYVSSSERALWLRDYIDTVEIVPVTAQVRECRHSKDDKFLELALSGRADLILTGDADLLALHPWRGIPILTAAQYLAS